MSGEYVPAFQPKVSVSQEEKDELLAYARVVYAGEGLALSHLRKPGSKTSLQRLEVVAAACVADGTLSVTIKQSRRANSTYAIYRVVGV